MAKLTDLWVNIGTKQDKLDQGLKQAEGKVKGFGTSVNKLGGMMAAAFGVSVVAVGAFINNMAKAAEGVDEVTAGFKRLDDPTLLERLRQAVSGTVTDLNLMKAAVRADSLGIPIKQLGAYFEFAERKAGELGVSTEQAVESLVNGIGNKSTRAFKELGISAISLNNSFKDIDASLMSVEEVSARTFIMINEELDKMGSAADSATDAIDRQRVSWENAKTAVGVFANELKAVLAPAVTGAVSWMTRLVKALQMPGSYKNLSNNMEMLKEYDKIAAEGAKIEEEKARKEALAAAKQVVANSNRLKALKDQKKAAQEVIDIRPVPTERISGKEGLIPQVDNFSITKDGITESLGGIKQSLDEVKVSYTNAGNAALMFAENVASVAGNVETLKDFANAVRLAARQAISAYIAEAVTAQIAKAMKNSKNPWVGLVVGAAAGAATSALFSKLIPSFAQGGIVNGPQLAMVGDNPGQKEAIIPSEMWGKTGTTRITGDLRLRGKDLYWSVKNYTDYMNRVT